MRARGSETDRATRSRGESVRTSPRDDAWVEVDPGRRRRSRPSRRVIFTSKSARLLKSQNIFPPAASAEIRISLGSGSDPNPLVTSSPRPAAFGKLRARRSRLAFSILRRLHASMSISLTPPARWARRARGASRRNRIRTARRATPPPPTRVDDPSPSSASSWESSRRSWSRGTWAGRARGGRLPFDRTRRRVALRSWRVLVRRVSRPAPRRRRR